MEKVSVIIPSWNRKEDLRLALTSVLKQDYPDFEVIVVDNGSHDGAPEMVMKEFLQVKLLRNETNLGTSIAKNMGVVSSNGSFILFLDNDIEMMHDKCISTMVKIMQEHPGIGALGGEAYKTPDGVITKRKEITSNCETSTYIMDNDTYQLYECGYVATCNCIMRKKDLEKCGGFDNDIIYAGEDKEIGYKLKKLGLKSVVDSRCLVYHYVSQKSRASNFFAFHKNRIKIFIKNYPVYQLPLLPLLDIVNLASPKKIKELKQNNRDITKWVHGKEQTVKKSAAILKIAIVGTDFLYSLAKAYLWNFVFLPDTLLARIKKRDNLREVKRKWLLQHN